ncbi:thiosulfate sulfurtransferase 16, chloroplastic-like [Rhodamnia argentea]|uniref:Thiosulfate sulfurtransferase 16, chloroplastic-like n=1 Tax=Rhodamnia argentea TaxID=178133 RepID=A0A8B8NTR2_9MYRT|nr:thiosulfate sulfurtransferase 16, chloroplastic-like [Rhodamnia argentea]
MALAMAVASTAVPASRLARSVLPLLPPHYLGFRWLADIPRNAESAAGESQSVMVNIAQELLSKGHRYLDVRTCDEFKAGHPSGALNIPYMFRTGAEMSKNPRFLDEVSSHFAKDDAFVVGCQSGRRSLMAVIDLQSAGYGRVANVAGGYSAWTEKGLPTSE